ncbi:MAG: type II toxin-antitoxin system VapC family toxin [Planctomycetes bacterium]|nr:type II toxin-antitoxin system VapC family toxin [Planctomycetota bacterium]
MSAFDADVLSQILQGHPALSRRAAQIPVHQQTVPIVVVEEILRGRLNSIRQSEAGKGKLTVERAYELFEATLNAFRHIVILPYTSQADALFQQWRSQNVRVGTHDLRIAAICVAHSAKLISRNRRDFEQVPGMEIEYWT